jgi:molybdate transport system ATP-binding protein
VSLLVDIKKGFGSFSLDVGFEVGDEAFALLGASGCGKSLTMRCIAGIVTPDEGRIVVDGTTFYDSAAGIDLTPQQRKTALLFQNYMLFPNLTVEENVGAGIDKGVSKQERARIIDEELTRFDVSAFRKRYPAQLSGGQQQRVALARMLAAHPGILMLDEPFSALDSHLKAMLEQNLASLFEAYRGTVLYVSHDIDEAIRFCDRVAVIDNGRIKEIDTGRELVDHPRCLAAMKLSGCKNTTRARYVDSSHVYCPEWGITVATGPLRVDPAVKHLGVRAFYVQRAFGPGENVFLVTVERVSDSRFARTVLLNFCDGDANGAESEGKGQIHAIHQSLFWRIDLLRQNRFPLPNKGDRLYIRIPPERVYLARD